MWKQVSQVLVLISISCVAFFTGYDYLYKDPNFSLDPKYDYEFQKVRLNDTNVNLFFNSIPPLYPEDLLLQQQDDFQNKTSNLNEAENLVQQLSQNYERILLQQIDSRKLTKKAHESKDQIDICKRKIFDENELSDSGIKQKMENLKEIQIKNQNINLELTKENRKLAILEGKIQSLENQKETLRQNLKSYNIEFLQKQIDTKAEVEESNKKKLEQFINTASQIKFYNQTIFKQVQDAKQSKQIQEQDPNKLFPLEYDEYIQNRTETMKKYSQDLKVIENQIIILQNQLKEQDNLEDKLKNYEQLRIKDEGEMQNVLEQLKQLKINKKDQKQIQKNLQYQQDQVQKKIFALRDEIDDLFSKNDDIINKINDQCSKYQTHFHSYKSELLWSMPKIDKKLISKTNKFISIISEL